MMTHRPANTCRSLLVIGTLSAVGTFASASPVEVLNFAGLNGNQTEAVDTYYDGGSGSLGSTGGPNYGIAFGTDAITCTGQPGGLCNTAQIPGGTGANALFFLTGPGDIMNVAAGFTTGFSFYYSAYNSPGQVTIWSGLNGTGTELASVNLAETNNGVTTSGCFGTNYCPYTAIGVAFAGTAESVNFTRTANKIAFADITLSSTTAGAPTSAPEMDSGSAVGALTLLLGAVAVMRGRGSKRVQINA